MRYKIFDILNYTETDVLNQIEEWERIFTEISKHMEIPLFLYREDTAGFKKTEEMKTWFYIFFEKGTFVITKNDGTFNAWEKKKLTESAYFKTKKCILNIIEKYYKFVENQAYLEPEK